MKWSKRQGWLSSLKINTVGELFLHPWPRQPTAAPSSPTYPYVQVTNSNSFFAADRKKRRKGQLLIMTPTEQKKHHEKAAFWRAMIIKEFSGKDFLFSECCIHTHTLAWKKKMLPPLQVMTRCGWSPLLHEKVPLLENCAHARWSFSFIIIPTLF